MIPFALPYDPDTAPVLDLVGFGNRPAFAPANYIGPRMDCIMWLPAPDADVAYVSKYDRPEIDPFAGTYGIGSDLVTAATFWPVTTTTSRTGCCETEQPAPVPLPSAGQLLAGLFLAALLARPVWRMAGRFGDWFSAERGAGEGKNGWV